MSEVSRRTFVRTTAAAGVSTALSTMRVVGANDRVRVGFIGAGNRGDQVLDAFLVHKDCRVVAVCDIYEPYVAFAARKIGENPARYSDYRRLLDSKEIDAVAICTPDHWHALQMIDACRAGKDIYVEKPLSLCVEEGRKMVGYARKYNRVTQVGIHRRSVPFCQEAARIIRSGALGRITVARAFHIQNEWPRGIGKPPDSEPPPGFDWDAWLGPAPKLPYNKNRTFYRFRWFYDYSGGQVTNFGVHYLDMIHSALGVDAPLAVTAMGSKLAIDDNRDIPDTLEAIWTYPGGTLVTFSQFNATGPAASARPAEIEFRGTKGTLYLRGNGYEIVPDDLTPNEFPARTPLDRNLERAYRNGSAPVIEPRTGEGKSDTAYHTRDFLDCVRSRGLCNCDIEFGHRSTSATLIANIAHRTRAYLEWDREQEQFKNNTAANRYLSYEYRKPYQFPS